MHSVLHYPDLVFHEAGHMIFGFFGDFMGTAGGTLMQLLMPAICLGTFLFKENNRFGAVVSTWWLGQSLMDCAPYAADARSQSLILLGGVTGKDVPGYHDWNNMLGRLHIAEHDQAIGAALHLGGAALILASLAWGAYLLWLQYQVAAERPF